MKAKPRLRTLKPRLALAADKLRTDTSRNRSLRGTSGGAWHTGRERILMRDKACASAANAERSGAAHASNLHRHTRARELTTAHPLSGGPGHKPQSEVAGACPSRCPLVPADG
jgi:hypothetical protein